jgi:serine protease Do
VIEDLADNASPAAKAGLQAGDIVTELNGKPIASAQDLTMAVADVAPGTSVQVGYVRNGAPSSVTVTVVERPSNPGLAGNESEQPDDQSATPSRQKLGVGIDDVSPEIAQQLRLKIANGAVIVAVDPNGVAADAGLQRGDVVHRFGKNEIKSAADLTSAVAAHPTGGKVVLQIERQGRLAFVTVDLG